MRIKIWDKLNSAEDEVEGWLEISTSTDAWEQDHLINSAVEDFAESRYDDDSEAFHHGPVEYQVRVEGREQLLTVKVWVDYSPNFSASIVSV